jgi:photosystem II stability/assembly factor-like uncharacterized protein
MRNFLLLLLICCGLAGAQNDLWLSHGPYSGDVKSIAIDYTNATVVYAGLSEGGVYKTIDGGLSWEAMNQGLLDRHVQIIKVDPFANDVLYAGTQFGGLFKSTDGGKVWKEANSGLTTINIRAIAFDESVTQRMFIASDYGVFESVNAGGSWTQLTSDSLTTLDLTSILYNRQDSTLFIGSKADGVFRLHATDTAWNQVNAGLSNLDIADLMIKSDVTREILVATWGGGVFRTTIAGTVGSFSAMDWAPNSSMIWLWNPATPVSSMLHPMAKGSIKVPTVVMYGWKATPVC